MLDTVRVALVNKDLGQFGHEFRTFMLSAVVPASVNVYAQATTIEHMLPRQVTPAPTSVKSDTALPAATGSGTDTVLVVIIILAVVLSLVSFAVVFHLKRVGARGLLSGMGWRKPSITGTDVGTDDEAAAPQATLPSGEF